MNPEWPIYPLVRQIMRHIARTGALLLLVPLILLLLQGIAMACITGSGATQAIPLLLRSVLPIFHTSQVAEAAGILLATLSALWCHEVLLARRGSAFTRMAGIFTAFLSLLWLASTLYSTLTGALLFIRQQELPIWIMTLLLASILFNLPNMAAAPLRWRILLLLYPLTHLLASILGSVRTLPSLLAGDTLSTLSGLAAALLLLKLSRLAPRIVSMPKK